MTIYIPFRKKKKLLEETNFVKRQPEKQTAFRKYHEMPT